MMLLSARSSVYRALKQWVTRPVSSPAHFSGHKTTKKLLLIGVVALFAALVVESISSYVLFRYFASSNKSFTPAGSSTYELLDHLVVTLRGEHKHVLVSADRFPLFIPDPRLGYVMNPGDYNILEDFDHHKHMFHLQVTADGGRATSYVPVKAAHRLFFTGDSSTFGWGLNDDQTIPWLLQSRMPNDQVLNLSLNSYSTVQALLQLSAVKPKLGPDDTVILLYHPVTTDFNVSALQRLEDLRVGYELQLGDLTQMMAMKIPYGALDASGELRVRRIPFSCLTRPSDRDCVRPPVSGAEAIRITERAFDGILALHPGHAVVAFVSGDDHDPVIEHLREKGVIVADLRLSDDEPDAHEALPTDKHAGPFWQYRVFNRLIAALRQERLVH